MMATGADPRLTTRSQGDVRPVVGATRAPLPTWLLVGAAGLAAILLFIVLDSRRQSLTAPSTRARPSELARLPAAPPPLFIPPDVRVVEPIPTISTVPSAPRIPAPPLARPMPSPPPPVTTYSPPARPSIMPPQLPPQRGATGGSALVIDTTSGVAEGAPTQNAGGNATQGGGVSVTGQGGGSRVRAGQFVNRATTVPQGTLIPAVLETALDSTRPGQVRALVSRDVRGFDGSRVLIQRGSRLLGEYRADLQPGQNRAFVQWTRLVRPDGVTIAIGSPAADPLGRAGIRGKVDSHFFERFGSAILQSTLDIGVGVATQRLGGSTVVVLPNGAQSTLQSAFPSRQVQPTLTVKQGARVTVFVARDLDFTGAGARAE